MNGGKRIGVEHRSPGCLMNWVRHHSKRMLEVPRWPLSVTLGTPLWHSKITAGEILILLASVYLQYK